MELEFIPERITIIKRLRGLSITDINERMKKISGAKNSYNIDRWEGNPSKHNFEKVVLLAKSTDVPVGFYYYKNVKVTLFDMIVKIYIADTNEEVTFNFLDK